MVRSLDGALQHDAMCVCVTGTDAATFVEGEESYLKELLIGIVGGRGIRSTPAQGDMLGLSLHFVRQLLTSLHHTHVDEHHTC